MVSVLISGASVAGPTLAWWLRHHGFDVTVVEVAPAPRPGGQAIDIRGTALQVVERMGILSALREVRTRMRGMSMHDADGVEQLRSTEMALSSGRFDNDDIELLREDLTDAVYRATAGTVEYLFGDTITGLDDGPDGVRVTFRHAAPRTVDLVVGADGLHSTVRRLAFGPEEPYLRRLGTHMAIFSAGNVLDLDNWQVWVTAGEVGYAATPVRDNTELRIAAGFASPAEAPDFRDTEGLRALVADRLAALRWETPKIIEALAGAPDLYCDEMAQIRMDAWSAGRVTLVGDAAYCPSPLSGQGTSLSLVGAYVLADELARAGGDHAAAFAAYEKRMRHYVELNQALATENPGRGAAEESVEAAKNAISLDA